MTFTLRPDQQSLIDRVEPSLRVGHRPCVVAPTGAGKTVVIAETARLALSRGERVVAIAHREEIINQIIDSLRRHLGPRQRIETVMAGSRSRYQAPITVAMVGTLSRRLQHLGPLKGATLLVDEAHHAGAKSWLATIFAIAPNRLVGFTATPVRPDGRGLGDTTPFTELLLGPHPHELMEAGHLCRYRIFAAPRQLSSKGLRKRGGDFVAADMERKVVEINGEIVPDWRRFNPDGLRTIVVGVSVDHTHQVAELFREAGIAAEAVDGNTPKAERRAIFARFRAGETVVLCACAVIDEGLDVPEATVLQITRPMASLRLWKQLLGRVLRPAPGKVEALVIDHTDNWQRLPPPDRQIDWQLNVELQEARKGPKQEVDPITREIVEGPPLEIATSGERLREVTGDVLERATPKKVRALLSAECEADIVRVCQGAAPPESLRHWTKRTAVLNDAVVRRLGVVLGLPPGWADGQLLIAGLLSQGQRTAMTRQLHPLA